MSLTSAADDDVKVFSLTVVCLDAVLREAFDTLWYKLDLNKSGKMGNSNDVWKQLTLSSHNASRYPGPGVSRRHATGKSGMTMYHQQKYNEWMSGTTALTMFCDPRLLLQAFLHDLRESFTRAVLHCAAL